MESFFFHLIPDRVHTIVRGRSNTFVGATNLSVDRLKLCLSEANCTVTSERASSEQDSLIIDDALCMRVSYIDGYVQVIAVEGCLSWFRRCIIDCYGAALAVNSIVSVSVGYPGAGEQPLGDFADFERCLWGIHGARFKHFTVRFGSMDVKLLPGDDFYRYWRDNHDRSIFSKMRKWFRRKTPPSGTE